MKGTEKVVGKCKECTTISKRDSTQEREGASLLLSQVIVCAQNPLVKIALLKTSVGWQGQNFHQGK